MNRTRKIQARYTVSGLAGYRKTKVAPLLELTGNWFTEAGFVPGQLVSIEITDGVLTIRPT